MSALPDPISVATAPHYTWGAGADGWHLVKHVDLSVIQERMPPGTSEVRHFHERSRQFFYVLSGVLTIEIEERRLTIGPREGVEIAPGVPHQAINVSAADVEFLVVSQPPSHGDRVAAGRP
jgi:mannose-6-phosphate isomerase-like protein (cupin superfamily)